MENNQTEHFGLQVNNLELANKASHISQESVQQKHKADRK